MVDLATLAAATSKMRTAQKHFAKKRTESSRKLAVAAEQEVDELLVILAPTNVTVQANLAEQTSLFR